MNANVKIDRDKQGYSKEIFSVFFVISILSLVYFNLITKEQLTLVSAQLPEFSLSVKQAIVNNYRITISLVLFFVDVLLVGPFAYLSYFGGHIIPKRALPIFDKLSFFDVGILQALVFTINLDSFHILMLDSVSEIKLTTGESYVILGFNLAIIVLCAFITLVKIYTYSPTQRRELAKYAIKF